MSLARALEQAASALPEVADAIRPANGDPSRLLASLEPAAAERVLTWLLAHEPGEGAELATAWGDDEKGTRVLLALDESALPKDGRKELRRALHRLRARGVALPAPAPRPLVAVPPAVDESLDAAFVSALDPAGARLIWQVEGNPGGGARLFEAVVDDERGVLDFAAYTTSRSEARRFLRDVVARERMPATAVPSSAARALLARAAAAQPSDRAFPRAFSEWRSRATAEPGPAPGELVREALGDEVTPDRLRRAAELVAEGAIGPWPGPEPALRAAVEILQEAVQSKLVVSAAQRRERLEGALREAMRSVYGPAVAARTAARLAETGYVLWKAGKEEDARACLAAARGLVQGPAEDQPVTRALIERVLAPLLERLRQEGSQEEGTSLIARP